MTLNQLFNWESIDDTVSFAEEKAAELLRQSKGRRSKTAKKEKRNHKQGRRKGKKGNNDKQRQEVKNKKRSSDKRETRAMHNARLFKRRFDLLNCDHGDHCHDEMSFKDTTQSTKFDDVLNNRDLLSYGILSYLDVVSLVQTKAVCTLWRDCCDVAIDAKGGKNKRAFTDGYHKDIDLGRISELRSTVVKYVKGDRDDIEDIAREYGYPIGKWDVSQVTDFSNVFGLQETFNEDISEWNVSNATTMESMFKCAVSFNGDLSRWDVSNATDMFGMFLGASNFNGDLSGWNVSKVTSMNFMFWEASNFNGDLSNWNVSNVTTMRGMFDYASSFNGDVSHWNVANVISMDCMFHWASSFNGDLSNWVPASLHNSDMFSNTPVNRPSWYRRHQLDNW